MAVQSYASTSSTITSVSQTRSSISSAARLITIARNFLVQYPRKARVLQSFSLKVRPIEEGFVATSNISDVYELGETAAQAATNCLSSLVDELIWFQEHKQSLSPALLKDFDKLQFHLRLV